MTSGIVPPRRRGIYDLKRGLNEDPSGFAKRVALAMVLDPKAGTLLASRFPPALARPTMTGGRPKSTRETE